MSVRTPRRRAVRVDVTLPRRSPRTAPMSIDGIHPATPLVTPQPSHAQFEIGGYGESSAYRHAVEDSETDSHAALHVPVTSPAVHPKTPRTRKMPSTASSTTRRSSRKKVAVDVSDDEAEMSDASTTQASGSTDSNVVRLSVDITSTQAPPLSPIMEESGDKSSSLRLKSPPRPVFDDSGRTTSASLGERFTSLMLTAWWYVGSRMYLLSSAILCWDVWLIVSMQHLTRCIRTPFTRVSGGAPTPVQSPAPRPVPTERPVQRPNGKTSHSTSARQLSPAVAIAVFLLLALLIFLLGARFLPKGGSSSAARARDMKIEVSKASNISESRLRYLIEAIVEAELQEALPKRFDAQSQKLQAQLIANTKQVSNEIDSSVVRVLTRDSTQAHRHWDGRIDTIVNKLKTELQQLISQEQAASDAKQLKSYQKDLQQLETNLADLRSKITSDQQSLGTQVTKLGQQQETMSTKLSDTMTTELSSLESRLLSNIAAQESEKKAQAAPPATAAPPSLEVIDESVKQQVGQVESSLTQQLRALESLIKSVEAKSQQTSDQVTSKASSGDVSSLSGRVDQLSRAHEEQDERLTQSLESAKTSSEEQTVDKQEMDAIARSVVQRIATSDSAEFEELHSWLDKRYSVASASLCNALPECKSKLVELLKTDIEGLVRQEVTAASPMTIPTGDTASPSGQASDLTPSVVAKMIDSRIEKFAADGIALYDYALESQGGQVYASGTSPAYDAGVRMKLLGINLYSLSYPPRLAISPDVLPGNCWPFAGSKGHITLILSAEIAVTNVSIDHIAAAVTTDGSRKSAPFEYTVTALAAAADTEGTLLGKFTYEQEGPTVQTHRVESSPAAVRYVRFNFLSNHGHSDYTCIYRLRVHGTVAAAAKNST